MKITNIPLIDLEQTFERFAVLNDLLWPDEEIGGQRMRNEFVKTVQRDWSTLSAEQLKDALSRWQRGETEIRKPRKLSIQFFGQMIFEFRKVERAVNPTLNRHSSYEHKPLPTNPDSVRKAWEYQFEDWLNMVENNGSPPISKVMEIHNRAALLAGIYSKDSYTPEQQKHAIHQFTKADLQENRNFAGDSIKKSLKQDLIKERQFDSHVGLLGAHYNDLIQRGVRRYEIPEEVFNELMR